MQLTKIMMLTFLYVTNAYSDSFFNFNGNVISTGRIIIDGQDINSNLSIKGSGIVKKITQNVEPFSSISSKGSFNIVYENGPLSVEVIGDDNLINEVSTKVVGDILMLSMNKSYNSNHELIVKISSPKMQYFNIVGTSNLTINNIKAKSLTIDLLGTVDVIANGSVSKLWLHVQGSGDVAAKKLITDFTNVYLNGTGDIQVTAKNELEISLIGAGDITYFGEPSEIKQNISGVGDISKGD